MNVATSITFQFCYHPVYHMPFTSQCMESSNLSVYHLVLISNASCRLVFLPPSSYHTVLRTAACIIPLTASVCLPYLFTPYCLLPFTATCHSIFLPHYLSGLQSLTLQYCLPLVFASSPFHYHCPPLLPACLPIHIYCHLPLTIQ